MNAQCCTGGGPSRRFARRLSGATACLLPGAALMLLPKCPLCLAAWLTVLTGIAVPVAPARVRGMIVVFWAAAVALAATQIIRSRANRRSQFPLPSAVLNIAQTGQRPHSSERITGYSEKAGTRCSYTAHGIQVDVCR